MRLSLSRKLRAEALPFYSKSISTLNQVFKHNCFVIRPSLMTLSAQKLRAFSFSSNSEFKSGGELGSLRRSEAKVLLISLSFWKGDDPFHLGESQRTRNVFEQTCSQQQQQLCWALRPSSRACQRWSQPRKATPSSSSSPRLKAAASSSTEPPSRWAPTTTSLLQ